MINSEKTKRFLNSAWGKANLEKSDDLGDIYIRTYCQDKAKPKISDEDFIKLQDSNRLREFLINSYLNGKAANLKGRYTMRDMILSKEEQEIVNNFEDLLDEDREAFIRSAYMTGLYMHLEKLQWAIMTDKEWKGGKRAIAFIKIQNMMNMAYDMIAPEYSYLLDDELEEWTEERRKREEI